ncbi:MAG TPA: apolipoprotein N-acyltransferase [Chthonomonadales bacterium]|nr:apolipoprotein N-acyltransferase [Chthonomonadales bacterium]
MFSNPQPSIADRPTEAQCRLLFPSVLLSAVLMTLAFPPVDAGFLAWVSLVPLLYVLPHARRMRHAFALGYLFGFVHWGWTISWIGTTVAVWVQSPIGWIAWFGLTAIKSGWFGLFGGVAWWILRRTSGHVRIVLPAAAWTVIEWLRTQGSVAMPWSLIGYTQYRYLPLVQIADVVGTYGLSFALVLTNAALAEWLHSGINAEKKLCWFGRTWWRALSLPTILLAIMLSYGAYCLTCEYGGESVRIALMQPNLGTQRTIVRMPEEELKLYRMMLETAASQKPNMVIWPESAAPGDAVRDSGVRSAFSEMARLSRAYQLVGSDRRDEQGHSYTSAVLFSPEGSLVDWYDKVSLVPFGEWTPARRWLPFEDFFHFPEDTTPGQRQTPLLASPVRMCILICYETVFPALSRKGVELGANLLVCITNDSWAGESAVVPQHIAMSALRAVETRRCLVTSATTGMTALVTPEGKITAAPPYRREVLLVEARLRDGLTPYVRWGDWLIVVCVTFLGIGLWRSRPISS